jgi:alkylated DNA nucleotide flippase Atl1
MNEKIVIEDRTKFHWARGARGVVRLPLGEAPAELPPGALPRVARLLALALHYRALVDRGEVRDYADIARLVGVTRARVTQIMDLLLLAPDVAEAILDLPRIVAGRDRPAEREVRAVALLAEWNKQRNAWDRLAAKLEDSTPR